MAADISLQEAVQLGSDAGRGNLLGIEPYLTFADYKSAAALAANLEGYLSEAARRGWLGHKTVVILPEYFGTWLALADEAEWVQRAESLGMLERRLVLVHFLDFLKCLLASDEAGRLEAALFRLKAVQMAAGLDTLLADSAARHGITIVGGSTVLPAPRVSAGHLLAGEGPLYGVTPVYDARGSAYPELVLKAYPTRDELRFMTPAPAPSLPAFETPAGRLGVLICADSWYPDCYARLNELQVEMIAVPSNGGDPAIWDRPWKGYSGWPPPADVDGRDVGVLTEAQAWQKYAIRARLSATPARSASNIFLRGQLLDMPGGGGVTTIVRDGEVLRAGGVAGGSIVNLWL
jgi:predicted amidohydrolase